jgi:hypothetical protein
VYVLPWPVCSDLIPPAGTCVKFVLQALAYLGKQLQRCSILCVLASLEDVRVAQLLQDTLPVIDTVQYSTVQYSNWGQGPNLGASQRAKGS